MSFRRMFKMDMLSDLRQVYSSCEHSSTDKCYFNRCNIPLFKHCCICSQTLSWVDIQGYVLLDNLKNLFGINLSDYPELQKLYDEVAGQPNIKKWIETRPKTDHQLWITLLVTSVEQQNDLAIYLLPILIPSNCV